jgi:phage-related protein
MLSVSVKTDDGLGVRCMTSRPGIGGDAADTGNRLDRWLQSVTQLTGLRPGVVRRVRLDHEQPLGEELRSREWRFYCAPGGGQSVKEELKELETEARAKIAEAMGRVRRLEHFEYELEHIDGDLKAVRVFFNECTYRVLFSQEGEHETVLLALHVTKKKTRKLSSKTKRLAMNRLRSWRKRGKVSS